MLDVLLVLILRSVYFARRPLGPVQWPWFILRSLVGGLGFSLPVDYRLNRRRAAA